MENGGQSLQEYGVRSGTIIQVFQKQYDIEYKSEQATSENIHKAVTFYRTIFKEMASSSTVMTILFKFHIRTPFSFDFWIFLLQNINERFFSLQKSIRPEVMKSVLEAYPEFHTNLGAYAILRDSILIQSMTDYEIAKNIGKQYPILIHSAEFVTKTIRENMAANKPNLIQNTQPAEDSMSDSSSESDSPTVSSNQRTGDIRQISRDQLAQALLLAGTSSSNSLSNIAQRNQAQSQSTQPSTSSTTSTSGTSASLISNSMFSNALSQALNAAGSGGGGSSGGGGVTGYSNQSTSAQPNPSSNENLAERYANELQTMREMGLFDEMNNIQALAVSNGDVEAAINLVLSGLGSFN